MRIGIVTQPLCANYGGILQNLALQEVLKGLGHSPITLDLVTHLNVSKKDYVRYFVSAIAKALLRRQRVRILSYNQKRPHVFDQFVNQYVVKTDPISSYTADLIEKYKLDCIIVGSDQVWRPRFNVFPEDMYLSFAKDKEIIRLAYAVSFGVDEWEYNDELTVKCRKLVQCFNGVSVREESGKVLCAKYLSVPAQVALDPTLLLKKDFYNSLCKEIKPSDEGYIAVYALNIPDDAKSSILSFASNNGLKVRYFTSDANYSLTIPQWIASFRDASYIITDSFHGTAFSIIYEKDFVSLTNKLRGISRFHSILSQIGLLDRLIEIEHPNMDVLNVPIEWNVINDRRENLIRNSLDYLRSFV